MIDTTCRGGSRTLPSLRPETTTCLPRTRGLPSSMRALAIALAAALAGASSTPAHAQQPASSARPDSGQRVILITGSTDGLGREVARTLAQSGAHVIVHGRNRERGQALVREIESEGKGSARFYAADLASLSQVRALADSILRDYDRLDVLINNAGIWLQSGGERRLSADGHELHFAVNYLSGFLLTRMLLPRLIASAPSRIINVASVAQTPIRFDDVMMQGGYSDGRAYGQSKLAQIMFTMDLARELEGKGVTVLAVHPATMMNTTMVLSRGAQPRSTVEEGVEAVVNLVTTPGLGSGQYFNGTRAARANAQAYDADALARLRVLSLELTGLGAPR